jgi:hypothetical protein
MASGQYNDSFDLSNLPPAIFDPLPELVVDHVVCSWDARYNSFNLR